MPLVKWGESHTARLGLWRALAFSHVFIPSRPQGLARRAVATKVAKALDLIASVSLVVRVGARLAREGKVSSPKLGGWGSGGPFAVPVDFDSRIAALSRSAH